MDTKLDVKRNLNVFKFDPAFEQSEAEWAAVRKELLGESSDDEAGDKDSGSEEEDDSGDAAGAAAAPAQTQVPPNLSLIFAAKSTSLRVHPDNRSFVRTVCCG